MSYVVKLVAQRLALGALLLLAISVLIFVGTEILPGDVAQSILGQSATPEALANLRRDLGLEEPALTRYVGWLGGVLTGDLGTALTNGADIATAIGKRLYNTVFLASVAAAVMYLWPFCSVFWLYDFTVGGQTSSFPAQRSRSYRYRNFSLVTCSSTLSP